MAASSAQLTHPQILKHNIKVGDFIMIAPDKEQDKRFLVSRIDGDEIYIHPGSRPSQMKLLTPSQREMREEEDEWILKSITPGEKITDWSHRLRHKYNPIDVDEIKLTWEERDTRMISFIPDDDDGNPSMDYRLIKHYIIEHVKVLEQDEPNPLKKYKVTDRKYDKGHFLGYKENIRIEARTYVGAMVTYMNWLDTQEIVDNDDFVWDQMDQYYFNPQNFDSVDGMVEEFSENASVLEQVTDEPTLISFPGPQIGLIKPVRN